MVTPEDFATLSTVFAEIVESMVVFLFYWFLK